MERRDFGRVRRLPSGRWQARFRDPATNELVSAGNTFITKSDAATFLATVEIDQLRRQWIPSEAGTVTLRSYADSWLSERHDLSVRTIEVYRHLLDRHVLPQLGAAKLARLQPSQIRAWHANISQHHPSTAAKAYRLLSSILRTAVADRWILESPCRVHRAGVERSAERSVATIAEVTRLAEVMPERLRLFVLLACWCQLRRAELLGLRRCDVDVMQGTISVAQTRTFTMKGRSLTKGPKTEAGRRTLAVPSNVTDALVGHMAHCVGPEPDAILFTGQQGAPLTKAFLHKAWTGARTSIGRPDLRIHDLRHTGLTLAAAAGATVAELKHRAGHESAAAALRYQHATADRDRSLADALAQLTTPSAITTTADGKRAQNCTRALRPQRTKETT